MKGINIYRGSVLTLEMQSLTRSSCPNFSKFSSDNGLIWQLTSAPLSWNKSFFNFSQSVSLDVGWKIQDRDYFSCLLSIVKGL